MLSSFVFIFACALCYLLRPSSFAFSHHRMRLPKFFLQSFSFYSFYSFYSNCYDQLVAMVKRKKNRARAGRRPGRTVPEQNRIRAEPCPSRTVPEQNHARAELCPSTIALEPNRAMY